MSNLVPPALKREIAEWSRWWVLMWVGITIQLLAAAFFMGVYDWMTLVAVEFGVPEFIGARVQDDKYPPLTHVIVKYAHAELAIPTLYGFAGAIGAHWLGFPRPGVMGALVGFIGWLDAHFLPRFLKKGE